MIRPGRRLRLLCCGRSGCLRLLLPVRLLWCRWPGCLGLRPLCRFDCRRLCLHGVEERRGTPPLLLQLRRASSWCCVGLLCTPWQQRLRLWNTGRLWQCRPRLRSCGLGQQGVEASTKGLLAVPLLFLRAQMSTSD